MSLDLTAKKGRGHMGKHVVVDATVSATMKCAQLAASGDWLAAEAVMQAEYDRGFSDGVDVGIDVEKGLIDKPISLTIPAPPPPMEDDDDPMPSERPSGIICVLPEAVAS